MESVATPHRANGESTLYLPGVEVFAKTAEQLRRFDEDVVRWVRRNPLAAVAVALGAGYVVGRVFSRWG